jgi:hypothetical protein
MTEQFHLPSWSARNPLGIVALFISLIYGMSAILLGTSIGSLSSSNQTILVIFIATFPFVVLGVFGWLVAKHHMKLYGPSDYRTDKSFLAAIATLSPSEVRKQLEREVADSTDDKSLSSPEQPQSDKTIAVQMAPGVGKSSTLQQAFLNETLVLQALQNEFRGSVRRNVRLPNGLQVDGIIEASDGSLIVVEMKSVGRRTRNVADVLYSLNRQADRIIASFVSPEYPVTPKIVLAIAFDGDPAELAKLRGTFEETRKRLGEKAELRVYQLSALLRDYGFRPEGETE